MREGLKSRKVSWTESVGVKEKATHIKDIQLCPKDYTELTSDGTKHKFVRIVHPVEDEQLQVYGRVQKRGPEEFEDPLGSEEVGLGITLRQSLGVKLGDTVGIEAVGFEPSGTSRQIANKILKIRPATCRARKAFFPDTGHRVCRLSEDTKQFIGIEWGDRVVLQSPDSRVRGIKALPITKDQKDQIKIRRKQNPEKYTRCSSKYNLERTTGANVDIPDIHISYSIRNELCLTEYSEAGVCQPVKVHRDTEDVGLRLLHDLTTPALLSAVAVIIGFKLPDWVKVSILSGALILIILSITYQSRRILLE